MNWDTFVICLTRKVSLLQGIYSARSDSVNDWSWFLAKDVYGILIHCTRWGKDLKLEITRNPGWWQLRIGRLVNLFWVYYNRVNNICLYPISKTIWKLLTASAYQLNSSYVSSFCPSKCTSWPRSNGCSSTSLRRVKNASLLKALFRTLKFVYLLSIHVRVKFTNIMWVLIDDLRPCLSSLLSSSFIKKDVSCSRTGGFTSQRDRTFQPLTPVREHTVGLYFENAVPVDESSTADRHRSPTVPAFQQPQIISQRPSSIPQPTAVRICRTRWIVDSSGRLVSRHHETPASLSLGWHVMSSWVVGLPARQSTHVTDDLLAFALAHPDRHRHTRHHRQNRTYTPRNTIYSPSCGVLESRTVVQSGHRCIAVPVHGTRYCLQRLITDWELCKWMCIISYTRWWACRVTR